MAVDQQQHPGDVQRGGGAVMSLVSPQGALQPRVRGISPAAEHAWAGQEEFADYLWAIITSSGHRDSGHLACEGYVHDDESRRITCTCGVVLYDPPSVTAEQAILAAIAGHQTYALTAPRDSGWMAVDEFAQCKCTPCGIARAAGIGFAECMQQRRDFYEAVNARGEECDRARYAVLYPGPEEVPF
jgi:hypothetical protein